MARARNIKPGFFKNEELADLGPHAMLLFAGLWTLADREGRLEDRPRRIEAEIFPYFDIDVDQLLDRLMGRGFIVRYCVKDEPSTAQARAKHGSYIQIANWHRHQHPHHKEVESTIPPVEKGERKSYEMNKNGMDGASTDQPWPKYEPTLTLARSKKNASCPTDSLNLDTSNSHTDARARDRFHEFWARYPNKVGQDQACRMWVSVVGEEDVKEVFAGLDRWLASERWARGIYNNPDKWLEQRLWKDSPPPAKAEETEEDPFANLYEGD